jgi:hypothetical protein
MISTRDSTADGWTAVAAPLRTSAGCSCSDSRVTASLGQGQGQPAAATNTTVTGFVWAGVMPVTLVPLPAGWQQLSLAVARGALALIISAQVPSRMHQKRSGMG